MNPGTNEHAASSKRVSPSCAAGILIVAELAKPQSSLAYGSGSNRLPGREAHACFRSTHIKPPRSGGSESRDRIRTGERANPALLRQLPASTQKPEFPQWDI